MEIISIILLVGLLSFFIYKIVKSMFTRSEPKVKLTTEQKQLKWSKIIYFICSIPILFGILDTVFLLTSHFNTRVVFEAMIVGVFMDLVVIALLFGYLMLNYNFIKLAYKRKIDDKKSIVFFSCLPGVVSFLFFFSKEIAVIAIPFVIIAPICNAYILSQSKKNKKSDKEY